MQPPLPAPLAWQRPRSVTGSASAAGDRPLPRDPRPGRPGTVAEGPGQRCTHAPTLRTWPPP